jgi:hypothetical protein
MGREEGILEKNLVFELGVGFDRGGVRGRRRVGGNRGKGAELTDP